MIYSLRNTTRLCRILRRSGAFFVPGFGNAPLKNFIKNAPKRRTPEIMRAKIDELGCLIRKAAEEIGISHTTLSRYIAHKIKRHNQDNDQKMIRWLEMN